MKVDPKRAQGILKIELEKFTLLNKISSNPPEYAIPSNFEKIIERMAEIDTIFNPDGSFNRKSHWAEGYALCLLADNKITSALELFNLIAGKEEELLFLHDPPDCDLYSSKEIEHAPGRLGFDGAFHYSKLLLNTNPNRAKKILLEIAEKIPTGGTGYLRDVRAAAIQILKDTLGVHLIMGKPIAEQLAIAKSHQC